MSNKLDRKALSEMVQIVVHPLGDKSEVTYLGGGRIVILPMEGSKIKKITIALPGYHDKTKRADLIIEKRNQSEASRVN